MTPLANALVPSERLDAPETFFPLVAYVCARCFLVQVPPVATPIELFADYPYYSSYSGARVAEAVDYASAVGARLGLRPGAFVVEVASNDGYLLEPLRGLGFEVLGIEPAEHVADVARQRGIETLTEFFGSQMAGSLPRQADLLIANNVLAHVPDIHDFVEGLRLALAPGGTLTIEAHHVLRMLQSSQFDSIYHEHHSYLSLRTMEGLLAEHGLVVVDVEEIAVHGGSLRVYARHTRSAHSVRDSVAVVRAAESAAGLDRLEPYHRFAAGIRRCKRSLLRFLIDAYEADERVVGYGAPAKATTLLNFCGVGPDLLTFTADQSPHKQGSYVPGVRIPVCAPSRIDDERPDVVLVLAWTLLDEIVRDLDRIRSWGGRFATPLPVTRVLP